MSGFTKLSASILTSSIWDASDSVRIIWITMLAMADQDGIVPASVGGIAHQARKTREETEAALAAFLSPDPDSKNPDNDGRRIERVTQGYKILNHHVYRELGMSESTKEYWRKKQQEHRSQRRVNDSQRHVCSMGMDTGSDKEGMQGEKKQTPDDDDASFIAELKALYSWVDMEKELVKMRGWLRVNPGRKLTRRFAVNWLNKTDKPLKANRENQI
jgi:hypothetical protein